MNEFLSFFDDIVDAYPMHLEIYFSKITDWCIHVYKKGCGENGENLEIVNVQNGDVALCFAEAQVSLKNWLSENEGGY